MELFLDSVGVVLDSEGESGPVPELEGADSNPTVTITSPRGSSEFIINDGDDSYIAYILEFFRKYKAAFYFTGKESRFHTSTASTN